MDSRSPAKKVIDAAGGVVILARLLRVDRSWVWRWLQPRIDGGTDGQIPSSHHKRILKLSGELGWGITAGDIIG